MPQRTNSDRNILNTTQKPVFDVNDNHVNDNHVNDNHVYQTDIAIIGAGAIGSLLYCQLAAIKQPLLLTRSRSVGATSHDDCSTITLETLNGDSLHQPCIQANINQLNKAALANIKLVIVCVKAYQVTDAIASILALIPQSCHTLLLHNGMGPHLEVLALLKQHPQLKLGLSLGTTSQAALKLAPMQVRHTGKGKSIIGHLSGPVMPLAIQNQLLAAVEDMSVVDDIVTSLWQKLLVNCAINPLTALAQCANGELAQPQFQQQIEAITQECIMVAKADGVNLSLLDSVAIINQVIKLTANNFSSMHQDIHHNRKTEILQINGYVVARAAHHGLTAAINQSMLTEITALESAL
ncbi:2-dehydropantoate 2-reductase [Shewanella sp. 10N.286.52.B9]|uniref:ketopantoate reductase family protein n=1 Tax=Shewanella sp. 10N.286.52.B9 TaxID=1880837 RepID=UPI000C833744|nr:2-dehydropantoate 2-reductase [Shewanella sp. 10N.286.52.B9]